MVNSATKRTLVLGKLESKTPVMLMGLDSPKNSKSEVLFYNSNTRSRMIDCSISFKWENLLITEIKDIFQNSRWQFLMGKPTNH